LTQKFQSLLIRALIEPLFLGIPADPSPTVGIKFFSMAALVTPAYAIYPLAFFDRRKSAEHLDAINGPTAKAIEAKPQPICRDLLPPPLPVGLAKFLSGL